MTFDVVVDSQFLELIDGEEFSGGSNKFVKSILNDYESGKWRYDLFNEYIWDNIQFAALSSAERESAIYKPQTKLKQSARNLRITKSRQDPGRGGEIAEILLYGIMMEYFKALPIVPKIFYKQNANDFAKGADSVHLVLNNDDFTIWFGEAKFYNDINDTRLDTIIESIGNMLEDKKIKKENSIIISNGDLQSLVSDKVVYEKIKSFLRQEMSLDELKPKLNIPIMLLHECDITNSSTRYTEEYKSNIKKYHKDRAYSFFKKQILMLSNVSLYEEIKFHLILFPVPKKSNIVEAFIKNANYYRE
ncbi:HamA C-terminal domain-containing protein [Acinetobacter bereziniae]|uniref:HamA C-terminal domain-containing protein n=1 Tax=Acinetobacter bereziniae TaxID=106648 RepID=UPI001250487D|nr:DUF1837 domain-containing protein [Acinetobacter bereziniae]